MRITSSRALRALTLVAAVLVLTVSLPARALAQRSEPPPEADGSSHARQLDRLFARLQATRDEAEGDDIVSQIWRLWLQSGDGEIDARMQTAILMMGQAPSLAMPMLDEIVKQKPDWAEGWNKRATALFLVGEYDRSLADIERVLALEPRHFGALAGIGLIRMEKGETREALAAFRRALGVNPFLKERLGLIPALEKELGEKPI